MAVSVPDARLPPQTTIDGHTITRQADGNISVEGPSIIRPRIPQSGDFDENLASTMVVSDRRTLAARLCEFADRDKDSRKDWARREETALVMLGITDIEADKDEEQGSNVTHPALMDATVRFQANAITELFPPTGPAETKILGSSTPKKTARAKRIRQFLNHYLVEIDDGYFNDTDKMLMYLPMGGSAFRKAYQDYTTGLPILRHVKATNFIAPYAGTDLKSMPRYAHKFTMTGEDIDRAQAIGMFADVYLPQPSIGTAEHAKAADISDLRQPNMHEDDRLYPVLEYHIDLELDIDEEGAGSDDLDEMDTGLRPYIIIVEADTEEILMIRRNWRQDDPKRAKRIWFAHHQFLPGLGFYGWGYPHVIGSLGMAASDAVKALLDGAFAANFQGGFYTKESRMTGEMRLEHGVWKAVDASAEDLAKSFYTPPFKEPSPALFQLLGALVEGVQRFSGTTDAAVGDGNNTGPVGTTVALIEQAGKPQSAIHKRLHVSMSDELQMLCKLIEDFMPNRYDYQLGDQQEFLLKQDFAPGVDVVCVTDPNVSSDTQRIMRGQAVLDMQKQSPQLYPPKQQAEAHRRMLVALKVPNMDAVAPEVEQPKYLDAVGENALIFKGMSAQVYPTQDDAAHIAIHQDAIDRAEALFPPEVFKLIQAHMQSHIQAHMASSYMKIMMKAAGLPPQFDQDGNPVGLDPQTEQMITSRVAGILSKLPHPNPKPGTKSAEQQMADAKVQAYVQMEQQKRTQQQQAFDADEQRKQMAFDNEERRKDQALNNQEARIDTTAATDAIRSQHQHGQALVQKSQTHLQDTVHTETGHMQDTRHAEEQHAQGLEHGDAQHEQDLTHGELEHGQQLEHADDSHEQGLQHGEEQHRQGIEHGKEAHAEKQRQAGEAAEAKLNQSDAAAKQKLRQGDEAHSQNLEHSDQSHEQGLEQGQEAHEQQTEQSDATHAQSLKQADETAQAAAAEEAEADSHQGGSVK